MEFKGGFKGSEAGRGEISADVDGRLTIAGGIEVPDRFPQREHRVGRAKGYGIPLP
jgi:hypothetical protein